MGYLSIQDGPQVDHLGRLEAAAFLGQVVGQLTIGIGLAVDQLRGRRVECDGDLLAGLVAGTLDGLEDRLDGCRIGRQ